MRAFALHRSSSCARFERGAAPCRRLAVQGGGDLDRRPGLARRRDPARAARRGAWYAIGAGIFGTQFGPVIGTIADGLGTRASFGGRAARHRAGGLRAQRAGCRRCPSAAPAGHACPRPHLRRGRLADVPALIAFGVSHGKAIMPLRLDDLSERVAMGAAFFVAALGEAVMSPLVASSTGAGYARSSRRTFLAAASVGLLAAPDSAIVLAAVLVVAAAALGALWTPSGSLVSLAPSSSGSTRAGRLRSTTSAGRRASRSDGLRRALGVFRRGWPRHCAPAVAARRAGRGALRGRRRSERSGPVATVLTVIAAELELDLDVFSGPLTCC